MALNPVKTNATSSKEIWQGKPEVAQGGFKLDLTGLTLGNTLLAGTIMILNEATRVATVSTADTDTPGGLLYQDTVIAANTFVDVVVRGKVYNRRIPARTATIRGKLSNIIFSESF